MRDIKRRRAGVESTGQITKAMKLVSTVKLQRAKDRALRSKTYFHGMYLTVKSLLSKSGNVDSPYTHYHYSIFPPTLQPQATSDLLSLDLPILDIFM